MKLTPLNQGLIFGIIGLLLIIFALLFFTWENDKHLQGLQSALSEMNSELITRRNREGKLISEKQVAEMRVKEFQEAYPKMAQAITKDFDLKLKNLRAYMQSEFKAVGSGEAKIEFKPTILPDLDGVFYDVQTKKVYAVENGDTIEYIRFEPFALMADDGYLSFIADVYSSTRTPYQYSYTDTLKFAFHMQGRWWQKKKLIGSGMLSNPNAKITNSQSVMIREFKDKRWGIGPYIGIGVSSELKPQTNFGISVHYSLIKF